VANDTAAADADTTAPNLAAFDSTALLRFEIQRMTRVIRSPLAPRPRKAMAAAFLGTAALQVGKRDTALALFRMAYRLHPTSRYLQLIKQFGDTVTP
jgi:cytochrome c-type biogenesis protein CcmH/NrfG